MVRRRATSAQTGHYALASRSTIAEALTVKGRTVRVRAFRRRNPFVTLFSRDHAWTVEILRPSDYRWWWSDWHESKSNSKPELLLLVEHVRGERAARHRVDELVAELSPGTRELLVVPDNAGRWTWRM